MNYWKPLAVTALWLGMGALTGPQSASAWQKSAHPIEKTARASTARPLPKQNSVKGLARYIEELKANAKRKEREKAQSVRPEREQEATSKSAAHSPEEEEQGEEAAGVDYWEAYLFQMRLRAFPGDTIDWDANLRAWDQRDAMPVAQMGSTRNPQIIGGAWEFVGPRNLSVPYRIYYGLGPLSGRINAVTYDPIDSNTYYIGTAGGGLWKTTDRGVNWTPLSDNWPSLQVSSISIHPTNNKIIYVGTGDFDGYGGLGYGLMKTIDGGATWTNLGKSNFGNFAVSAIALDPENPNILTVATGRPPDWWSVIWRSTDGGVTWNTVISEFAAWSDLDYGAKNGAGRRYLYAVGHYNGGQIWRSADRGATWTRLAPPISAVNWYDHNALEIAASPTAPDTVYLLVGHDRKILKSVNGGNTWTDITAGFPNGMTSSPNYNWSQTDYDIHLECATRTINNTTNDVIYAGLIDLAMSRDAGATWQALGGTYTDSAILHNDQHCLAVNPRNPNETLVGCDGGIYRLTYNATANTWSFTSLNANLGVTQIYKMAAHPTDATRLLLGTQDNATPAARGSLTTWNNVAGGDGGFAAIRDANIQYATAQNLALYKTTNNWVGASYIRPDTGSDRVAFIAPITLNPAGNLLYAGTNYLYQWNEADSSWASRLGGVSLASPTSSASGIITIIAVAPSDASRIYTGADSGEVWMTTDTGATWTKINTGTTSIPERAITSLAVNPTNPDILLVGVSGTGSGHLWRCANTRAGGTRTWSDVSGAGVTGLPDISLNAIALDPDAPSTTWYVGMDAGVFMTQNSGAAWSNATAPLGLPNVQIMDLKAVTATRTLYAATYGRGLWKIALPTTVRTVAGTITLQNAVNKAQFVTFEFRPISGGMAFSRTIPLNANGGYSLAQVPAGNYNLAIKGSKWLRKVIAVNVTSTSVNNANATLKAGDANDDNGVDVFDLDPLIAAFDASYGDILFNPAADFNCDGSVDVLDLDLLIQNFDLSGDA